jgi:hypothetical protein
MAPITINFMLACYTSASPPAQLSEGQWNSPSGQEARAWLRDNGLVDNSYNATERGKAWVQFICSTPLPVAVWTLPARTRAEMETA